LSSDNIVHLDAAHGELVDSLRAAADMAEAGELEDVFLLGLTNEGEAVSITTVAGENVFKLLGCIETLKTAILINVFDEE
jgi:hypothetical protein